MPTEFNFNWFLCCQFIAVNFLTSSGNTIQPHCHLWPETKDSVPQSSFTHFKKPLIFLILKWGLYIFSACNFPPGIPPWKGGAKDDLLRKAPTVTAMTWHGQYKRQTQGRLNTSKTCALKTTVTSIFALALWEVSQKVIFKNSPNFPFINFLVWKICGFPSETTAFLGGLNNRDKTRPCREE